MNGEIAAANQRLASSGFRDSARQGAAIAFHSATNSSNTKPQPSAAAEAAVASTANRHADLRRPEMESQTGPEVGSVKDKIGRFTTNPQAPTSASSVRGRSPQATLSPPPEQIAARLAASRSPKRNPEPASAAARIGALRSASRAQPQPAEDRRELRAPTPIRTNYSTASPVNSILQQDDRISLAGDSGYGRSPSLPPRAASVRERAPSPQFSISSRISTSALSAPPDEAKPRLPPRSTGPSVSTARKPVSNGTLLRSATPSMASLSAQSNNSSSSAVNEMGGMNEEALSNAIVASSLASSRASPVTKIPPTPPRRRRARSILHVAHSPRGEPSRTPSPPKAMPHTLRGMPKPDEAEAHRRHKMHLLHKHPHKHHEGDRKRWRREVTEKERKRYEGVWASNKGLHVPASWRTEKWPPPTEMVLNLVVREIWSRSRLPSAVLEQVWDLVDHQHIGLLTKEEFVVGMWLIDQQLKGHKLPTSVPDSVWDSVRYVTGIRLSSTAGKG